MNMEIKTFATSEIKPYPNNPRKNDSAVESVMESIKQCGYCSPIIVDENMVILAGHTRFKAIKRLGWKECPVLIRTGMTEEQIGGSGTTIMACEQNGRIGYVMEYDPKYVDVIINRWESFTGEKAVLLNG